MSSSAAKHKQKKKEPWRNQERHYCAVCNTWMGGDRQSILLHENGKKHCANVEEALQKKRKDKLEEETQNKLLQSTLAQIEATARGKMGMSSVGGNGSGSGSGANGAGAMARQHYQHQHHQQHHRNGGNPRGPAHVPNQMHPAARSFSHAPQQMMHPGATTNTPTTTPQPPNTTSGMMNAVPAPTPNDQQRQNWQARREKRKQNDDDEEEEQPNNKKRIRLEPGQGHYTVGATTTTYLEGRYFYEILEEELPIQLWVGSDEVGMEERRLRNNYWKDAIVAGVVRNNDIIVHVSYLKSPDDEDETLEKNVKLDRIRMILGGDDRIPDNLHEARLLAMGGEEIEVDASNDNNGQQATVKQEVDESTGLTGWSTVTIKRTTVRQELKEERDRLRQKRKETADEKEKQKKEAEYRRMEEAKVANADDSALGAYDVWGKGGYKGIDIQKEANIKVEETAKSLASGKSKIAFKKKTFKKKKNNNRRTTTADD